MQYFVDQYNKTMHCSKNKTKNVVIQEKKLNYRELQNLFSSLSFKYKNYNASKVLLY